MSGPDQQVPVCAVNANGEPIPPSQRAIEIREYKANYLSMMVAVLLAKSRRETDGTDDITSATANCHITNQPAPPSNPSNPFNNPS